MLFLSLHLEVAFPLKASNFVAAWKGCHSEKTYIFIKKILQFKVWFEIILFHF